MRDHPFLLFMASSTLATMTYVAFETLLPISVATVHGVSPATWGFLMIANPVLVTVLQLRLTRAVARVPASLKLGVAMPLMGLPFLILNVASGVAAVGVLAGVFGLLAARGHDHVAVAQTA